MAYQSIRKVPPRQSGRAAPSPAMTEDGLNTTRVSAAHAMTPCPAAGGTNTPHPQGRHGLSARAPRGGVPSGSGRLFFYVSVRSPCLPLPPRIARAARMPERDIPECAYL
ncbi:hypothetical protein MSKU15_3121 [Komagataeibacter diospyri]|nr:hypothetical protein MSKU15_3121 [Komagataeibacter diospyri]